MTPTKYLFSMLRWMTLPDHFIFRKLLLSFKVSNNLTPEYMNVFKHVHETSTRNTRRSNSNMLFTPRSRTEYYKRSFTVSGTILWNNLIVDIRNCKIISAFKKQYLEQYFTSEG